MQFEFQHKKPWKRTAAGHRLHLNDFQIRLFVTNPDPVSLQSIHSNQLIKMHLWNRFFKMSKVYFKFTIRRKHRLIKWSTVWKNCMCLYFLYCPLKTHSYFTILKRTDWNWLKKLNNTHQQISQLMDKVFQKSFPASTVKEPQRGREERRETRAVSRSTAEWPAEWPDEPAEPEATQSDFGRPRGVLPAATSEVFDALCGKHCVLLCDGC